MPDPIAVKTTHNPDPGWSQEERQARVTIYRKKRELETLKSLLEKQESRLSQSVDDIKVATWEMRTSKTKSLISRCQRELIQAEAELELALERALSS